MSGPGTRAFPLSAADARLLASWVRAGTTPQRVARRAQVVLLAAEGASARAIARQLAISPHTAALWIRRYEAGGPSSLWNDAPGRGRKPSIQPEAAAHLQALLSTTPPDGRRWSIRRLAEATGLSRASVHRIVRPARLR